MSKSNDEDEEYLEEVRLNKKLKAIFEERYALFAIPRSKPRKLIVRRWVCPHQWTRLYH